VLLRVVAIYVVVVHLVCIAGMYLWLLVDGDAAHSGLVLSQ
jgi:hypothetical protein